MKHYSKYMAIILAFCCLTKNTQASTSSALTCDQWLALEKILLVDIGVMGLASHDLFAWDRKKKQNRENGRLDLSTLFDSDKKGNLVSDPEFWKNTRLNAGGNQKNSENAPVFTTAMQLVKRYQDLILIQPKSYSEREIRFAARVQLVQEWNTMVSVSFTRLTGLRWPQPAEGTVNNQEQAAMRILHDILPGTITRSNGVSFCVTDASTAKTYLSDQEMAQQVKTFDGRYDSQYHDIKIPLFKVFKLHLNLEKIDAAFISEAGLDPIQSRQELIGVASQQLDMEDTSFGKYLIALFSKAQSRMNQDGSENVWLKR